MSRLSQVKATNTGIQDIIAAHGAYDNPCDNQYKIYLVLRDISETLAMLYDDIHSPKISHEEEVILDKMFKDI
mgnify:CR=1 FL=1